LSASGSKAVLHALRGLVISRTTPDPDAARAEFERALALDPEEPIALEGLGQVAAASGRVNEAVDLFDRAARADENAVTALRAQAQLLIDDGRRDEARESLTRLIERDPLAGRDALALAQLLLGDAESRRDPRIEALLRCASRFGGGTEAERLLERWQADLGGAGTAPS